MPAFWAYGAPGLRTVRGPLPPSLRRAHRSHMLRLPRAKLLRRDDRLLRATLIRSHRRGHIDDEILAPATEGI